jgi:hypothetical protein
MVEQSGGEKEKVVLVAGQPLGKYILSAGVAGLMIGFILLGGGSMTAAPLMIILSLVVIGLGLWTM